MNIAAYIDRSCKSVLEYFIQSRTSSCGGQATMSIGYWCQMQISHFSLLIWISWLFSCGWETNYQLYRSGDGSLQAHNQSAPINICTSGSTLQLYPIEETDQKPMGCVSHDRTNYFIVGTVLPYFYRNTNDIDKWYWNESPSYLYFQTTFAIPTHSWWFLYVVSSLPGHFLLPNPIPI